MIKYFTLIIWILFSFYNYSQSDILISPKSNVLQGERVNISCSIPKQKTTLLWLHNNKEVGYDDTSYVHNFIEILKLNNRFYIIIKSVTLQYTGIWQCQVGNTFSSVQLNVSVPWTLKAIEIKKINTKPVSHSPLNLSCDEIETGEKRWPYNLGKDHYIQITCESECGLPGPGFISVQFINSTKNGELSGGTQKLEKCAQYPQLRKLTHVISINCLKNNLTGSNQIRCQSQDARGNSISNKPVYILCPIHTRQDVLTHGEIVAIAISIVLAIIDILIIVFLLRRNCRELSNQKLSNYKYDKSNGSEVML